MRATPPSSTCRALRCQPRTSSCLRIPAAALTSRALSMGRMRVMCSHSHPPTHSRAHAQGACMLGAGCLLSAVPCFASELEREVAELEEEASRCG